MELADPPVWVDLTAEHRAWRLPSLRTSELDHRRGQPVHHAHLDARLGDLPQERGSEVEDRHAIATRERLTERRVRASGVGHRPHRIGEESFQAARILLRETPQELLECDPRLLAVRFGRDRALGVVARESEARAMMQDPHVRLGRSDHVRGLARRVVEDVAQHENRALPRPERLERQQERERGALEDAVPRLGRARSGGGELAFGRIAFDRRRQPRAVVTAPLSPAESVEGEVRRHAHEPRAKALVLGRGSPLEGPDERFLYDVLRVGGAPRQAVGEAPESPLLPLEERSESRGRGFRLRSRLRPASHLPSNVRDPAGVTGSDRDLAPAYGGHFASVRAVASLQWEARRRGLVGQGGGYGEAGAMTNIDAFLSLPLWVITIVVFLGWGAVAVVTHRVLVPWIAGREGSKLGGFEAEVVALMGLTFGLLISFNAVTVWQTVDMARDAVIREVAALEEAGYEIDALADADRERAKETLRKYVDYVLDTEWPLLAYGEAQTERPQPLLDLIAIGREVGHDHLYDALDTAVDARMERIRLSLYRMSRARWSVVIWLAALLTISMGLLHAEHPRGRAVALTFVAIAIGVCFIILFAHGRPFVGENALQPTDLRTLADRLAQS